MLHGPDRARRGRARVRGARGSRDLRRVSDRGVRRRLRIGGRSISRNGLWALIWTTTPWTIPSNLAIAVHPDETYAVVEAGDRRLPRRREARRGRREGRGLDRLEDRAPSAGVRPRRTCATAIPLPPESRGELTPEEAVARLPHRARRLRHDGRGHRARPHGARATARTTSRPASARTCPILSPVDEGGRFTTVAKYHGKKVLEANAEIVEDLRAAGALVAVDTHFRHEYPHCWRCKKPVIFRATVQWFVRLDDPKTDVRAGRPRRDRPDRLDPAVGRGAHRRHGREPPRVGRLPAAEVGLADHAPLRDARRGARRDLSLEGLARGAGEVLRAARRDLRAGGRRRVVRAARRGLPARRTPIAAASPSSRRRPTSWTSGSTRASRTWPCCAPGSGRSSRAAERRPAGRRLPRGSRPAPRLVPVVAADLGRALRRRARSGP